MTTRRRFIQAGGTVLAGLALPPWWVAQPTAAKVVEIAMGRPPGSKVWFDPVGVLVAPATTIRWVVRENVHTATAYHPKNGRHSLRIPEGAEPWDSGYLVNPGDHFEVTLTVPGIYDYFCLPHEAAGMVGRIIGGEADRPGQQALRLLRRPARRRGLAPVPAAARSAFPSITQVMKER